MMLTTSFNKKPHRGRLRGGAFVGEKLRFERPRTKGKVGGNKGGHTGNGPGPARHRKQHHFCKGRPGTYQGTCVMNITTLGPEDRRLCTCGGCNARKLRKGQWR